MERLVEKVVGASMEAAKPISGGGVDAGDQQGQTASGSPFQGGAGPVRLAGRDGTVPDAAVVAVV